MRRIVINVRGNVAHTVNDSHAATIFTDCGIVIWVPTSRPAEPCDRPCKRCQAARRKK
jgi:hypothetical protein